MIGLGPAPTLEAHRRRPIRAFLADRRIDENVEAEFWDHVYRAAPLIDHLTAFAIDCELTNSPRLVGEIIDGTYRPNSLGEINKKGGAA